MPAKGWPKITCPLCKVTSVLDDATESEIEHEEGCPLTDYSSDNLRNLSPQEVGRIRSRLRRSREELK